MYVQLVRVEVGRSLSGPNTMNPNTLSCMQGTTTFEWAFLFLTNKRTVYMCFDI